MPGGAAHERGCGVAADDADDADDELRVGRLGQLGEDALDALAAAHAATARVEPGGGGSRRGWRAVHDRGCHKPRGIRTKVSARRATTSPTVRTGSARCGCWLRYCVCCHTDGMDTVCCHAATARRCPQPQVAGGRTCTCTCVGRVRQELRSEAQQWSRWTAGPLWSGT